MNLWRFAVAAVVGSIVLQAHAQPANDDFRQTPEWKALNRLVGTWDHRITLTVPEGKEGRGTDTVAWILGDRFLQIRTRLDDTSEAMHLIAYDPNRQALRHWWFSSQGIATVATGSWDEASATFSYKVEDTGPMSITSTNRLADDDHREWRVAVKDGEGKLVYEMSGRSTRQNKAAEKPPADAPKMATDSARSTITVTPGDIDDITPGFSQIVYAVPTRAAGPLKLCVRGARESGDRQWRSLPMWPHGEKPGHFFGVISKVTEPIEYYVAMGDVKSDVYRIGIEGEEEDNASAAKPPAARVDASPPPKTAADTFKRAIELLKSGDADAAAMYYQPWPDMDLAAELRRGADVLKSGRIAVELTDSREDGDLAVVVVTAIRKAEDGSGPDRKHGPIPMLRSDGIWRMHNGIGNLKLPGTAKEKMDVLWKWGQDRSDELNGAARAASTQPAGTTATQPAAGGAATDLRQRTGTVDDPPKTAAAKPPAARGDDPPKTAADMGKRIVELLEAGESTAAARHFQSPPGMDMAEEMKRAAEEIRDGDTVTLVDSREDGDLAVITWKIVKKGQDGNDVRYRPAAMIRKDGEWRIYPRIEEAELNGPAREKMEALWKWAIRVHGEPQSEFTDPAIPESIKQCQNNVKTLLTAVLMYAQDNRDVLPDKIERVIDPYVRTNRVLRNPRQPDRPNGYVWVKPAEKISQVRNAARTIVLYEAYDKWPEGGLVVGFLDGHVEVLADEETFKQKLVKPTP